MEIPATMTIASQPQDSGSDEGHGGSPSVKAPLESGSEAGPPACLRT